MIEIKVDEAEIKNYLMQRIDKKINEILEAATYEHTAMGQEVRRHVVERVSNKFIENKQLEILNKIKIEELINPIKLEIIKKVNRKI